MNYREHAYSLLEEFDLCCLAKPKHDAIAVQIEKDKVAPWAYHLNSQLAWGTDSDIAEACHQLETRLVQLKEKLIMEILTNGNV